MVGAADGACVAAADQGFFFPSSPPSSSSYQPQMQHYTGENRSETSHPRTIEPTGRRRGVIKLLPSEMRACASLPGWTCVVFFIDLARFCFFCCFCNAHPR